MQKGAMDGKKQNTVAAVWRKISTQSISSEECVVKVESENSHDLGDAGKPKVGIEVKEVFCSISNCVPDVENGHGENKVLDEPVDPNARFEALQDSNAAGRASESGSTASGGMKHSISFEAGASLMRFIKGKGGSTQKKIEEDMGVNIIFPSSKKEDCIMIEGNSAESVASASERIQFIIDEVVRSSSLDYSHFVSLPLAIHPELVDKLVKFQDAILGITDLNKGMNVDGDSNGHTSDEDCRNQELDTTSRIAVQMKAQDHHKEVKVDITSIPLVSYTPKASKSSTLASTNSRLSELGIEKSIFIKPKTFHLTVLMLKLWNKDRVDAAAKVLRNVSSKVMDALDSRPVSIRLTGLECMRGSLAKARVLYVPVEEIGGEKRLSRACQVIINAFVEAGLVLEKDAQHELKLHATVMNARHRKRIRGTRKVDSFDARHVVDQFGAEEWGDYPIREAHLSQRFVFDENGYYNCCASIPFPESMQVD